MKNREDMNWEEEKAYILTRPHGKERLEIAEGCEHLICGLCGESLDAGRTWSCMFLRDKPEGTLITCDKWKKKENL